MNKREQATGGVQKYTDGKIWQIVGLLIRPAMLWRNNHYQHEFTFDRKTFFLFLTIIINQKVQTTKEMRNQANYKFTVCWVCLAVIKSVCKIVWRAASVLFVFQWYYNRRGGGHQHREGSPHFHSTQPQSIAVLNFGSEYFLPVTLCHSDWKCAWCALQLRLLSNLFISQFELCIELTVYTFCPSSFELFSSSSPSYRSVSNLYRSCLRVGQGCTIPPRWRFSSNIYQRLPLLLLGKVWTLCASFGKVGPGIQPWREYGVVTAFPPSAPLVPSHTDCRVTAEAATPLFEAGAWFLPPPSSPPTLFQVVKLFHCYTKSLLTHLHHT